MSRRKGLLAGILVLRSFIGSAASSRAHADWLDNNGPLVGCRFIPGDLRPAWLCFIAAMHRAPAPAPWQGHSAKADVLLPGTTVPRRPGA